MLISYLLYGRLYVDKSYIIVGETIGLPLILHVIHVIAIELSRLFYGKTDFLR